MFDIGIQLCRILYAARRVDARHQRRQPGLNQELGGISWVGTLGDFAHGHGSLVFHSVAEG